MNRRRRMFSVVSAATTSTCSGPSDGVLSTGYVYSASVTGGPSAPQGTVTWFVDGVNTATDTLDAFGQVSRTFSFGTTGNHTVYFTYAPVDATWLASTSNLVNTMIRIATSTSTILQGGSSVHYGAAQVIQSTTTPNPGSGLTVYFYVDGSFVGQSTTNASGVAVFDIGNSRNVGTYGIGTIFLRQGSYEQSGSSNATSYSVVQATTTANTPSQSANPTDWTIAWTLTSTFTTSTGVNLNGSYRVFRNNSFYSDYTITNTLSDSVTITTEAAAGSNLWSVQWLGSTNIAASGVSTALSHETTKQSSFMGTPVTTPAAPMDSGISFNVIVDCTFERSAQAADGVVIIARNIANNVDTTLGTIPMSIDFGNGIMRFDGNLTSPAAGDYTLRARKVSTARTYTFGEAGNDNTSTEGVRSPWNIA